MTDEPTANPMMTRQEQLLPTGMHDTHLYDPNAADDRVVAMFETMERAGAARDALVKAGVPEDRIQVLDRSASATEFGDVPDREAGTGIWDTIKNLFVPDEYAHGYAEGMYRGHAMVAVTPAPGERLRVVQALEELDPVDFDARLEEWRSAGWNGIHAGQEEYEARRTAAPGMAPATQAAGSATASPAGRATDVVSTGEPHGTSGSGVEATGQAGAANPTAAGATPYDLNAGRVPLAQARQQDGIAMPREAGSAPTNVASTDTARSDASRGSVSPAASGNPAGRGAAAPAGSTTMTGMGPTATGTGTASASTLGGVTPEPSGTGIGGATSGTTVPGLGTGATGGAAARTDTASSGSAPARTGAIRPGTTAPDTGEQRIPIVEERLEVGKRAAEAGRVRVHSYAVERPVEQQVQLRNEQVNIERRPVDRPAAQAGADPFGERIIEATATREEPVIAKEARVKEEIALSKQATERTETVRDTVRETRVEVEDDRNRSSSTTGGNTGTTPPKS